MDFAELDVEAALDLSEELDESVEPDDDSVLAEPLVELFSPVGEPLLAVFVGSRLSVR